MTIRIWIKHDRLLKYRKQEFQNKTKSLPTEGTVKNRCLFCKHVQLDAVIRTTKTKTNGNFLPAEKYNTVCFTKPKQNLPRKKIKQTHINIAVINSIHCKVNFTSHNLNQVSKYWNVNYFKILIISLGFQVGREKNKVTLKSSW